MQTLQEALCQECASLAIAQNYTMLAPEGGAPSTTFTLGVFALPHLSNIAHFCGFNTACRPTDIDGGLHLPIFGQFYLCSNDSDVQSEDITVRALKFIRQVIANVSAKLQLGIGNVEFTSFPYEWKAASTGYIGKAFELNIQTMQVNEALITLDGIEVVQANVFSQSGSKAGRTSELIVISIDRLIAVISLAMSQVSAGGTLPKRYELSALYPQEAYSVLYQNAYSRNQIEEAIARFSLPSTNPSSDYRRLVKYLERLQSLAKATSNHFPFRKFLRALATWSRLLELAFARGAIATETRTHLIHKVRTLFEAVASAIAASPATALDEIIYASEQEIFYPGLHFLAEYVRRPILAEHAETLEKQTWSRTELLENVITSPAQVLRVQMLDRLQSLDFGKALEKQSRYILADGGSNADRMENWQTIVAHLPISSWEQTRTLLALSAIDRAEGSATVRTYPEHKAFMAVFFDRGEIALAEHCYDLHNLNEIASLRDRTELAVIFSYCLDRAIRAIKCYGYVPQGSRSDYLAARQSRNFAIETAIRLDLQAELIMTLINCSLTGGNSKPGLSVVQSFFLERLNRQRSLQSSVLG